MNARRTIIEMVRGVREMSDVTITTTYFSTLQCQKCEQFYDLFAQSEAELLEMVREYTCNCTPDEVEAGRRKNAENVERLRELLGW
ncbi:MAG: hypothetical protein V3W22_06880 [Thermoplasmata archaeon]